MQNELITALSLWKVLSFFLFWWNG